MEREPLISLEKVLDVYAGHENSYFVVEDYIDIEPVWLEF